MFRASSPSSVLKSSKKSACRLAFTEFSWLPVVCRWEMPLLYTVARLPTAF
jgi:hypothetical protein